MRRFVLILIVVPALAGAAPIYKCVDGAGRTQFTDQPCPASSNGLVINPLSDAPAKPDFFGPPITQHAAANQCESAARRSATNPSTVDFSRFWSAAFQPFPDGRATYFSQFTAKNAYGLELNFDVACYFKGARLDKFAVNEAR